MSIDNPKPASPALDSLASNAPPEPSTPPRKRFSAALLQTPDQHYEHLPYSPSLKRTSSGSYKSPDDRLHSGLSPAAGSMLKTPRPSGDDSDDQHELRKAPKIPQFFLPAKKLFDDDSAPELAEISLQLRSRLSSAMDKLQQDKHTRQLPTKAAVGDLGFLPSPSKKLRPDRSSSQGAGQPSDNSPRLSGSPTRLAKLEPVQPANLNLQTLQHSPVPHGAASFSHSPQLGLRLLPQFSEERPIRVPSPDEEASAHHALMAAISRQRRKSRTSFSSSEKRRPSMTDTPLGLKLPPINMPLKQDKKPTNEQDAVYSLMSLLSPQASKFAPSRTHSRSHSMNASNSSSRSSSVVSPQHGHAPVHQLQTVQTTVLPPISGLIKTAGYNDNDATDIENDSTDEDVDS